MYVFSKYKAQYVANLKLALPVVLTQLGQILTQFADNLMVGRYGGDDPTPLAAVSFGGSVFFILFITAAGVALGLTPLVGELYAQGDRKRSALLLHNGIIFYTLLGIGTSVVQYLASPLLCLRAPTCKTHSRRAFFLYSVRAMETSACMHPLHRGAAQPRLH